MLNGFILPLSKNVYFLTGSHTNNDNLWQRPKKKLHDVHKNWYDNIAVGKDTLGPIMKSLSEKAKFFKNVYQPLYKAFSSRYTRWE